MASDTFIRNENGLRGLMQAGTKGQAAQWIGPGSKSLPWPQFDTSKKAILFLHVVPHGFEIITRAASEIKVQRLIIEGVALEAADLRAIVASCPHADSFVMTSSSAMRKEEFADIADKDLALYEKSSLSGQDLSVLGELSELEYLDLSGYDLLPEGPVFLEKLSGLKHLTLRHTNLEDDHLGQIAKLSNIQSLVLDSTNVTGASLSLLASCEKLSIVQLSGNKIDSSSLADELQLYFKVCPHPSLRSLVLVDCELTPEAIETIKAKVPFLNFRVTSTKLDAENVMPSVDQTPQRIRELVAAATFLERAYEIVLLGARSEDGKLVVDGIGLKSHSEPVADWAMNYVSLMADVTAINIFYSTLSREGLSRIQNLNLKYLTLEKGRIGREGLEAISKFPNLQGLSLKKTEIIESELSTLKELKNLSTIVLDKSNVTDAGLQVLSQFPALKAISVANCDITDAGARYLEKVKLLQHVNLEGCPISPDVMKELSAKCKQNSEAERSTQE